MSKKYDGFAIKNKWGTILLWTAAYLKRDVIKKLGGLKDYQERWKKHGHKIVKVRLVEVE